MPTKSQVFRHSFGGGWATDFGPYADVAVEQGGRVVFPWLNEANNCFYELDGGPHKIGGTTVVNSTTVESGQQIRGLFDFWKTGTGGSPAQKLIIHAGTKVLEQTLDASTFSDLFTSMTDDTIPSYATFDDLAIIMQSGQDGTADVPRSWDGSTPQDLAGSPPNFSFGATHKNRFWAAGTEATPSRLAYSQFLNPENWTGGGSGTIDINPDDGDSITGLVSFKNDLWVFKGPHKGSIHRITGSAPTGADAFSRLDFITEGLGAVYHNLIFKFRDDVGFMWTDGSIHSLKATSAFGDYIEATLSHGINSWLVDNINFGRLKYGWAATDISRGYTLITFPTGSSTDNNQMLMMDFRFTPVRWAQWNAFDSGALASVVDGGCPAIFSGSNTGFVRRTQVSARSIDGAAAITYIARSPFIDYTLPGKFKTISRASVGVAPTGIFGGIFAWVRDTNSEDQLAFDQGAVGGTLPFTLGMDRLGGASFNHRFLTLEEGGEFRAIQYAVLNSGSGQDIELHSLTSTIHFDADSSEND